MKEILLPDRDTEPRHTGPDYPAVLKLALGIILIMIACEAAKTLIFPGISLTASRTITIAFTTLAVTAAAYFSMGRQRSIADGFGQRLRFISGVLDSTHTMVLITDPDGKIVEFNGTAQRVISGEGSLLGTVLWDLDMEEGERNTLRKLIHEAAKGAVSATCEVYFRDSVVRCSARPLPGNSGFIVLSGTDISEQERLILRHRKIGEELRELTYRTEEQAKMLDTILSVTPDHILMQNREGKYLYVSSAAALSMKLSREEITGKSWRELGLPQEQMARMDRERAWVCATRQEFTGEYRLELPGGEQYFEYIISPIFSKMNNVEAVVVTSRDISQRRKTEDELRRSREQYRTLLDKLPLPLAVYDEDEILYVNPATVTLFAAGSEGDITARQPFSLLHPDQQESGREALRRFLSGSGGTSLPLEWQYMSFDGRVIEAEQTSIPVSYGERNAVLAVIRDVTEQKQSAEQIRRQAALIDKTHDAIFVQGLDRKILFWNKGAERHYGWTSAEALNRDAYSLLGGEASPVPENAYREVRERGEWSGELLQQTKSGREIVVESRWALLTGRSGGQSILVTNRDITEKKQLEKQFLQVQRMESIGRLAGGIAHDLNNALAPVMLAVDVLKSDKTDREQKLRMLSMIESSVRHGSEMIRQVLAFARGLDGERSLMQARTIMQEIEKIVRETFPKSIYLNTDYARELWMIPADPTQIHQILLNLCLNARDAMPQGGRLTIGAENILLDEAYASVHLDARPGRYLMLSVGDSGTGIPRDIVEKIFEPFFTTKEIGKGSGLGLSTVAAIVKSHGGFVTVYSEAGRGTIFKVYLPASEEEAASEDPAAEKAPERGNGEMILVVDDEVQISSMLKISLEMHGYRVLVANEGSEAVAVYAQNINNVSAVITDMMMPYMDGASTIRALKKINPFVKIIAASGLRENNSDAYVSGNIEAFLAKPYRTQQLLESLAKVLEN